MNTRIIPSFYARLALRDTNCVVMSLDFLAMESAKTIKIAPHGDVVFLVGADKRRLRVHSLFVKTASPVFNTMLSSNFKEGQQLANAGSVEIALPEDNATAMEIIFNVIHGRNDRVQADICPNDLLQVAIACDKYDCYVSLSFVVRLWLSDAKVAESKNLWPLAVAACLFRRARAFAVTTCALVHNHAGSYLDLASECKGVMDSVMLLRIAAMLEEARNKLRMDLLTDLLGGDWYYGSSVNMCSYPKELVRRISNIGGMTVSSFLEALPQSRNSSSLFDINDLDPRLKPFKDNFETKHKNAGELCLWCVRTGEDHKEHDLLHESSI